jgi:hypothetical protein
MPKIFWAIEEFNCQLAHYPFYFYKIKENQHLVRILANLLLLRTLKFPDFRAVSSVGRAPALQAGCRGFESLTAHRQIQAYQSVQRLLDKKRYCR